MTVHRAAAGLSATLSKLFPPPFQSDLPCLHGQQSQARPSPGARCAGQASEPSPPDVQYTPSEPLLLRWSNENGRDGKASKVKWSKPCVPSPL